MNDLVQRLRDWACGGTNFNALLLEAADRIKQLEREQAECRDAFSAPLPNSEIEHAWSQAMNTPGAVAAYITSRARQLDRENAELRKDADRYHWLVTNCKCWSWHNGLFSAYQTGYLCFDFETAIDMAIEEQKQ